MVDGKQESDRKKALARLARQLKSPALREEYLAVIKNAVRRLNIRPVKEVEFLLGAAAGFVLSLVVVSLLSSVFPIAAPMAVLFLFLPLTISGGIAFARVFTIGKPAFKPEEQVTMERIQYRYRQKIQAIEMRRKQLREAGFTEKEIEEKLGPLEDDALAQSMEDLDRSVPAAMAMVNEDVAKLPRQDGAGAGSPIIVPDRALPSSPPEPAPVEAPPGIPKAAPLRPATDKRDDGMRAPSPD